MKREDRLVITACLEEIAAVVKGAKRPLTRKVFLDVRRWHRFQKEMLKELGYKGKISRMPKHIVKKEVVDTTI